MFLDLEFTDNNKNNNNFIDKKKILHRPQLARLVEAGHCVQKKNLRLTKERYSSEINEIKNEILLRTRYGMIEKKELNKL